MAPPGRPKGEEHRRAQPQQGKAAARVPHREILNSLKKTFGLERLRTGQEAVIQRVMAGRSTLAVMPTGAGKSLCYQLPALLLPGMTVVVSPLIALMKDQCDGLRERGIDAVQLNSAVEAEAAQAAQEAIGEGRARIVFTTPEKLADPGFAALLSRHEVSLMVVDEAHCISQWGHDFRPAFLEIGAAAQALGAACVLGLTATATARVVDDVCGQLGIPKAGVVNTGTYRPNLVLAVEPLSREEDKLDRSVAFVREHAGAGLVYTATVKAAQAVFEALASAGESVGLYHGRLGAADRRTVQDDFMAGRVRVMVATNAFGLGIDKADTRFVLHHQMPSGLDAYYQEAGRAGRDGEEAACTLLFLKSDKAVQQFFLAGRYPTVEDIVGVYQALNDPPPGDAAPGGWSLDTLQAQLGRPRDKLRVVVSLLRRGGIVAAGTVSSPERLVLRRPGLEVAALQGLLEAYRNKQEGDRDMLERMVFYAQTGHCRWQTLLSHFEAEPLEGPCGTCDNCVRLRGHLAAQAAAQDTAIEAAAAARPRPVVPFEPGQRVRAKRYGDGVVVACDTLTVTVAFEGGTERCFQNGFVRPEPRRRRGVVATG
jgi:ATP-dependent DNA helicase RecQ